MERVKRTNTTRRNNRFDNRLILSVIVIAFYFLWPQLINMLKKMMELDKTGDLIFGLISNLLLIGVLIFIYRKDFKEYAIKFKKNLKKSIITIILYAFLSVIVVILVNAVVINILHIDQVTANDMSLFESFEAFPLLIAFMTIIYYPIVEEIVFEKTLKDVINNKWLFIFVSALFFWYYNIAYTGNFTGATILSSLYYFVLAFIRALAFYKTNNLYVPIGIKAVYNAFVTLLS